MSYTLNEGCQILCNNILCDNSDEAPFLRYDHASECHVDVRYEINPDVCVIDRKIVKLLIGIDAHLCYENSRYGDGDAIAFALTENDVDQFSNLMSASGNGPCDFASEWRRVDDEKHGMVVFGRIHDWRTIVRLAEKYRSAPFGVRVFPDEIQELVYAGNSVSWCQQDLDLLGHEWFSKYQSLVARLLERVELAASIPEVAAPSSGGRL